MRAERVDGGRVAEWVERIGRDPHPLSQRARAPIASAHDHTNGRGSQISMRRFGVLVASLALLSSRWLLLQLRGRWLAAATSIRSRITHVRQSDARRPTFRRSCTTNCTRELQRRLGVRDAPRRSRRRAGAWRDRVVRCGHSSGLQRQSAAGGDRAASLADHDRSRDHRPVQRSRAVSATSRLREEADYANAPKPTDDSRRSENCAKIIEGVQSNW